LPFVPNVRRKYMQIEEYFRNKGCVVTGAASGIGLAISEVLLQAGAVVFMADRDTKMLASAVDELAAHAGRVHSVNVDVTNPEQVKQLIQDAASRHGRLDFLFNNAGIGGGMPIGEATIEHWRRIIDINLWGVIYGVHAAIPIMRHQGGGHIINTASLSGLIPIPFQALYNTTKYAVVGFSESLRLELVDEGIQVSVVCPSAVVSRIWGTPIIGERQEVKSPDYAIPSEEAAQSILVGVANKRGIIVLPEYAVQMWLQYRTSRESSEKLLLNMARERRKALQST